METIRSVIEEQQQTSNYILSLAMNVQQATAVVRDSTKEQSIGKRRDREGDGAGPDARQQPA